MKIVCFGPGPMFKGGISNYNTSLAKSMDKLGHETHIVSWTQQYPAIIPREFVDKSSKVDLLDGTNIQVKYITNYNNPFSWNETVRYIKSLNADKVIIQWAIAIQGLPLGYIARKLIKSGIEVIFDLHFVIQKEHSSIDKMLTKYGIKKCSAYVAHARKTFLELQSVYPTKQFQLLEEKTTLKQGQTPVIKLYHPVYDIFAPQASFNKDKFKADNNLKENVFLFFGFIRKYKGLHNVIKAFNKLSKERDDVSLIICGESFWNTLDNNKWSTKLKSFFFGIAKAIFLKSKDNEKEYNPLALVDELNLHDNVMIKNEFVANEEVHKYFQASDAVVLFYEYATPSGVESIGYNFHMPILATKVGHFPETVTDGFNGYLAEPELIDDMSAQMNRFIEQPINRNNVAETVKNMSWENYSKAILEWI